MGETPRNERSLFPFYYLFGPIISGITMGFLKPPIHGGVEREGEGPRSTLTYTCAETKQVSSQRGRNPTPSNSGLDTLSGALPKDRHNCYVTTLLVFRVLLDLFLVSFLFGLHVCLLPSKWKESFTSTSPSSRPNLSCRCRVPITK